jgi:hypothetical protein
LNKLNVSELLQEGWELLFKCPVVLIPIGINTICFMLQMHYPSVSSFILTMLLNFFLYFLATQYVYEGILGNPSWRSAFHFMRPKWPALFIAVLGWLFITMLGIFALIIPGIWIMVRLGMCDYAVIFDQKNVMDSYKESWRLTDGSFWRVFIILFVLYLPDFISDALPKTNRFLAVKFFLLLMSQAWTLTTMLRVYLKLKDIKNDVRA